MNAEIDSIREKLLDIDRQRSEIRTKIEKIVVELEKPENGGLKGSLNTKDGFPRDDVDIFTTCKLRNQYNCLNNDYIALSEEAERLLQRHFQLLQADGPVLSKKVN